MPTPPSTEKPGQRFVSALIACTVIWILTYAVSHNIISGDHPVASVNLSETYRLTPQGEFVLLDVEAIVWVVGKANVTPILQRLDSRTAQIRALMNNVRVSSERLNANLLHALGDGYYQIDNPLTFINNALTISSCATRCNPWNDAYLKLVTYSAGLSAIPNLRSSVDVMNQLLNQLTQLKQQADQQWRDTQALRPSRVKTFFWNSPKGSSLEVLFFAVFGVLTNLLVTSAEYLRQGNFKQSERWVAYTKLVYGPVLAWIMVTAIAVGWFDLGEYQIGTFSLPLLAFILGFYSRRTVNLFDKLGAKILGKAEKSIEKGPADIAASNRAYLEQFMNSTSPRSISEIRENASELKDRLVKTIALEKDLNK